MQDSHWLTTPDHKDSLRSRVTKLGSLYLFAFRFAHHRFTASLDEEEMANEEKGNDGKMIFGGEEEKKEGRKWLQ